MKKIIFLIVSVIMLSSCSSVSEKTADNLDLKMIYDDERPCAETTDGYYSTECINGAEYNIIYTDYATNETIALCNRAECTHNDNSCTSYIENIGSRIFTDNNYLYVVNAGVAGDLQIEPYMIAKITRKDLNGSNDKIIYEFPAQTSIKGSIVEDKENNLYFLMYRAEEKDNDIEYNKYIVRLSQNGELTELTQVSYIGIIYGASGDNIYLLDMSEDDEYKLIEYSISDGKSNEVLSWKPGDYKGQIYNGYFCYVDTKNNTVNKYDLANRKNEIIVSDFNYRKDDINFYKIIDNEMLMSVRDMSNGLDNSEYKRISVNIEDHQVKQSSLSYIDGTKSYPVSILGSYNDKYYVIHGSEYRTIQLPGKNGSWYETEGEFSKYAMISKSDYWAGIPNYEETKISY